MLIEMARDFELLGTPKPLVTVAMPVFNGGSHLPLAVKSIVSQSYKNWELLVIDDGSTDSALLQVEDLIVDDRVSIISDGHNKGISSRLNQAVAMAKGEFFARMDHDDISHPHRLLLQLKFLQKNTHIDLVSTDCVTIDSFQKIVGYLSAPEAHLQLCKRPWLSFPLAHPTWMGRTSWFLENPYSDPGPFRCEDNDLLLRSYRNSTFGNLSVPLLAYRISSQKQLIQKFKTRIALMSVQSSFFLEKSEYKYFSLSVFAMVARLLKDLLHLNYLLSLYKILFRVRVAAANQKQFISEWNKILRGFEPEG